MHRQQGDARFTELERRNQELATRNAELEARVAKLEAWVSHVKVKVKPFDADCQIALGKSVREAAQVKEDLADIINIASQELVRQAFELPGFTTIHEEAQRGRAEVNRGFYAQVFVSLGEGTGTPSISRNRNVSYGAASQSTK